MKEQQLYGYLTVIFILPQRTVEDKIDFPLQT